ncbi:MAG: DNA polymerase III subunit gamma/tau [Planctomycetaceae bacterium]|nr:DNA polymerase III subunit gamma/tau [Planctomycetaceae bacterium]
METTASYTVLARRYRPQTFDDVVGQQHVAQALRNAIRADRVAHAYLFTGARGVGKTSMARILAKALNCKQAVDGNPCNTCEICQAISTGGDVDVMEIDGASNRGIDDIRALRANVGIRSMRTRVKMYIIDEVHMLTKEAFNALLKTLEEPPPNVKFVFCTTEPQKVPDTILSRCQRFDFSSIETQKIAERLAEIAVQEGIEVASDAIDLVARRAGGSMRDSQSLFDQLLAFGGSRIEARDVNQLLGTADDERLLKIVRFARQRQTAELLQEIDLAHHEGVQLGNLVDQLVNCYRDLLVLRCGAQSVELIGIGPANRQALQALSQEFNLPTLSAIMQILSETKSKLAWVSHGRALVDLALIRISQLENLEEISQLITDLKSGNFPVGTAPSHARVNPASPPLALSASAQKKTPESPLPVVPEVVSPPSRIDFEESRKESIWTQLIDSIDDTIKVHLKKVSRTAIIAPNRLDIFFPATYAFSKSCFEDKPELVRRVEARLRELTGITVQIRFHLDPPKGSSDTKTEDVPRGSTVALPQQKPDFVASAEGIFSATVSRAERIRRNVE